MFASRRKIFYKLFPEAIRKLFPEFLRILDIPLDIRGEFSFRRAEIVYTWILSPPKDLARIIRCQTLNLVVSRWILAKIAVQRDRYRADCESTLGFIRLLSRESIVTHVSDSHTSTHLASVNSFPRRKHRRFETFMMPVDIYLRKLFASFASRRRASYRLNDIHSAIKRSSNNKALTGIILSITSCASHWIISRSRYRAMGRSAPEFHGRR